MITKRIIAKFVVAIALTIVTFAASGVVAGQMGIELGPAVYACGHNGGGGC